MEGLPENPRVATLGIHYAFCNSAEGLLTDFNSGFCFSKGPCLCTPGVAVWCTTNLYPISCKIINEHLFHILFSFSTLGLGWGSSAETEEPWPCCVLSQPTPTAQAVVVGGSVPTWARPALCCSTGCTLGTKGGGSLWFQWRLTFPHLASSLVPAGIAQVSCLWLITRWP